MSGLPHIENSSIKNDFISGEPGTTGREPFEDSYAPPAQGSHAIGAGSGHTYDHDHTGDNCVHSSHGRGLTGALAGSHSNRQYDHEHLGDDCKHASHRFTSGYDHEHANDNCAHPSHHGSHQQQQHGIVDKLTAGSGHAHANEHSHDHNRTGAGVASAAGLGGGMTGAVGHRDHNDRVGHVGQDSAKYEGDLSSGPRTSGAAGTDRFDSDRTGVAGNVGSALDRKHDDGVHQDTSQRAPGQGTGGLSGLLTTTDKEFTGRDRKGEGAYADTDGPYSHNQTGPAGNTALTGREGNLDNNPVAQKTHDLGAHAGQTSSTTGTTATGEEHKEGFLAKVKHAVIG